MSRKPSRESVTTIGEDGSRPFLHPADVRGPWTRWRRFVALVLIGLYVSLPWIPVGGRPAVFLDVMERRFHLLGFTFTAQDFWLSFFLITGVAFILFYATALVGRLWCGWACPQTVFLEHVYRRLERWLEGDATARRKLDAAPWTPAKAARRASKHILFVLVSILIAHLFLAYFVSIPKLHGWILQGPAASPAAFLFVLITTAIIYFNFAWFREQLCLILCPYGRLQSALIDEHSVIIGYDEKRGEPRGKPSNPDAGDCIDCSRCVQVCPTGIDIRHGLQMECIACANCIDACDSVMEQLGRPRGLIRHDSQTALEGGKTRFWRPRIRVYTVLLLLGIAVSATMLGRVDFYHSSVTRMTGAPYFITEETIRNHYMVRLINKRDTPAEFRFAVEDAPTQLRISGASEVIRLDPMEERETPVIAHLDRTGWTGNFEFTLRTEEIASGKSQRTQLRFLGPDPRLLKPTAADTAAESDADREK